MINMSFHVGFDAEKRPIVTYHKYGPKGASQIFAARWEDDRWAIRQLSDWQWRWEFGGGGAIASEVGAGAARVLDDGRLVLGFRNAKEGGGTWGTGSGDAEGEGQGAPAGDVPRQHPHTGVGLRQA